MRSCPSRRDDHTPPTHALMLVEQPSVLAAGELLIWLLAPWSSGAMLAETGEAVIHRPCASCRHTPPRLSLARPPPPSSAQSQHASPGTPSSYSHSPYLGGGCFFRLLLLWRDGVVGECPAMFCPPHVGYINPRLSQHTRFLSNQIKQLQPQDDLTCPTSLEFEIFFIVFFFCSNSIGSWCFAQRQTLVCKSSVLHHFPTPSAVCKPNGHLDATPDVFTFHPFGRQESFDSISCTWMNRYDRSRAPFRNLTHAQRRCMAVASSPHALTTFRLTLVRSDRTEHRDRRVSFALFALCIQTSWLGSNICCRKDATLCPRAALYSASTSMHSKSQYRTHQYWDAHS